MNELTDKPDRRQDYATGFFGLIAGALATWAFKLVIYDAYFAIKRFPDYGPTLFAGNDPVVWDILYVVFVATSFGAANLISIGLHRAPELKVWFGKIPTSLIIILVASIGVVLIPAKLVTLTGSSSDIIKQSLYWLMGLALSWGILRLHANKTSSYFEKLLAFFFGLMCILQAPKLHGIYYLIASSGKQTAYVLLLLSIVAYLVGVAFTVALTIDSKKFWRVFLLLVGVYVLSIMEGRIYWSSDGFHDAEGLISAAILTGKNTIYHGGEFVPVHGYLRNIWTTYLAAVIQSDNYFIFRLTEALLVPCINVGLVACVVALSQREAVGVAVFCLFYLFKLFIPFDHEMVLTMVVMVSLLKVRSGWPDQLQRIGLGLLLLALALVSFETLLFSNIALFALLAKIGFDHFLGKGGGPTLRDKLLTHLVFYGGAVLLAITHPARAVATLQLLFGSFSKSPNLLERDLILTGQFDVTWFYIVAFAPIVIWFYLSNLSSLLRVDPRDKNPEGMIRLFVSMLFLMFLIRAFNRSDDGHVLYAMWIALPLALGYMIRDKVLQANRFIGLTAIMLLGLVGFDISQGRAPMERYRQAAWYDSRLSREAIRPIEQVGRIKSPTGVFNDSLVTRSELQKFLDLQSKGYDLFDLINMPTVFYGLVGFRVLTPDFHTLFLNTYKEQQEIITRLRHNDRTLVAWSANYWTETLDYTYVETRLPLITRFVASEFRHVYTVGRFIVLSKYLVPELVDVKSTSGELRREYSLGKAPAKMTSYKQEEVRISASVAIPGDLERKPDALSVIFVQSASGRHFLRITAGTTEVVAVGFDVARGGNEHFIRLSNLPRYNMEDQPLRVSVTDERGQEVTDCRATAIWFSFP